MENNETLFAMYLNHLLVRCLNSQVITAVIKLKCHILLLLCNLNLARYVNQPSAITIITRLNAMLHSFISTSFQTYV